MKALLTSAGIKNATINEAMVDLLGKPIAESSALCIPTGSYEHPFHPFIGWRFIAGRSPNTPLRESGLAELLPSLHDTVYVGLSAGSMVLTPSIGEDFMFWKPPTGADKALGIVDFSIFPHVDHPDLPENTMAAAEKWAAALPNPATRLTTTPPSAWPTARSTSSARATGGTSRTEASAAPRHRIQRPCARASRSSRSAAVISRAGLGERA
jgi:hypothetical protein